MPHLSEITIKQFRGLRDLTLEGLGRVNVLVGANNSGKTSVLEAVNLFCRPLDALEWVSTAWRREVNGSRTPLLDALKELFPQTAGAPAELYTGEIRITGQARLTVQGEVGPLDVRATFSEFVGVGSPLQAAGYVPVDALEAEELVAEAGLALSRDARRRGADIALECRGGAPARVEREGFQLWEGESFKTSHAAPGPRLNVATISPVAHGVDQLQIAQISEALLNGVVRSEILSVLHLLDPGFEDLEILSRRGLRPTLYGRHRDTGLAPISSFGDGIRRVLLIAVTLLQIQEGILLIDEVETAIHTAALQAVYRWLVQACRERHVQLFATTHSLEAVDALLAAHEAGLEDLVVYRLNPPGQPAQRFGGELLHRIRYKRGLDVR